jgi:hypothetical protein
MNCNNNPTRRSSTRLCKKYDKVWSSSSASPSREHHWIKNKILGKSGKQSREKPLGTILLWYLVVAPRFGL